MTAEASESSRLAHLEDYCIEKDGNFSINPRAAPGDQWAPFAGGNGRGDIHRWMKTRGGNKQKTTTAKTID